MKLNTKLTKTNTWTETNKIEHFKPHNIFKNSSFCLHVIPALVLWAQNSRTYACKYRKSVDEPSSFFRNVISLIHYLLFILI